MPEGYFIRQGDKTECGGEVIQGNGRVMMASAEHACEGDPVSCGKDGNIYEIAGGVSYFISQGRRVAGTLDSYSTCPCRAKLIASSHRQVYGKADDYTPAAGRAVTPTPASAPATAADASQTCVFAKSCVSVPPGSTDAGTTPEPATHFGATALLASTGAAGSLGRVAGTLGRDLGSWTVRGLAGASSALSVALLALWPRDIGDSTLYTPEQLANMRAASTRVRFQFRRDIQGVTQIYGLHTKVGSGTDSVPVTHATWNADKSALAAVLDGISITWTPNNGPLVNAPSPYPGIPERLDNLLVHPIAPGRETQISHYPGQDAEDLTWLDTIITFPADSGVPPLYLVFAKPAVKPLEVDTYGAFTKRPREGTEVDHMPSQAALKRYLQDRTELDDEEIKALMKSAGSIAIPARVHKKYSETYGWRNTKTKQQLDAGNLRSAVDSNFDAIKPYMLEEGFSDPEIEEARAKLHKVNEEQRWY